MARWRCPCLPPFVTRISQTPAIYPAMILYISKLISMSSVVFLKNILQSAVHFLCVSRFAKLRNIFFLHLHSSFIFFISLHSLPSYPGQLCPRSHGFSPSSAVKILDNTINSDILAKIFTTSLHWSTAVIKIVVKIKKCVHCSWITARRLMIHG